MKERLPYHEKDRQRPAEPPARTDDTSALVLQLQQTAGNQATARLLQRFGVADIILGPGLSKGFEWLVWNRLVRMNRESATYQPIDTSWRQLALQYSRENPTDGGWIRMGIARMPDFWLGGWFIGEAGIGHPRHHARRQTRSSTRTPLAEPNVDTYVHELVHAGAIRHPRGHRIPRLRTRRSSSRAMSASGGDDIEGVPPRSAHEQQASAIEERFSAWRQQKEKADAEEEAKKPTPLDPIKEAEDAMPPLSRRSPRSAPFPLGGSVGAKSDNLPDDVARVAGRLHALGFLDPRRPPTSAPSPRRSSAYQSEVLRWPRPRRSRRCQQQDA